MRISKKDYGTAAKIVAAKAIEMHKKGANWRRGNQFLTCVDIGKIADKLLQLSEPESKFSYPWDKKPQMKKIVSLKNQAPLRG